MRSRKRDGSEIATIVLLLLFLNFFSGTISMDLAKADSASNAMFLWFFVFSAVAMIFFVLRDLPAALLALYPVAVAGIPSDLIGGPWSSAQLVLSLIFLVAHLFSVLKWQKARLLQRPRMLTPFDGVFLAGLPIALFAARWLADGHFPLSPEYWSSGKHIGILIATPFLLYGAWLARPLGGLPAQE